jgi:hypothetical protein
MESKPVTHTHHHLPRVYYVGEICVAITARVEDGRPIFSKSDIVLEDCAVRMTAWCPFTVSCWNIYTCWSKERKSRRIPGRQSLNSHIAPALGWQRIPSAGWQKDFFDRILGRDDALSRQVWYIVNNPVRRGLVEKWKIIPVRAQSDSI